MKTFAGILSVLFFFVGINLAAADAIRDGFLSPPASARPWVFWYWIDGQIDRDGITKDLEAMARNGIGGVVLGDIAHKTDKDSKKFLSPEWQELFAHTLREAKRLGLVISTCPSAGWCALGGPWVKPEDSMQVLVWSKVRVAGPQHFKGTLPKPQTVEGYYRDVAVVAFPSAGEPMDAIKEITATMAKDDPARLIDGNPQTTVTFKGGPEGERPSVTLRFKHPVKVRGVSVEFIGLPKLGGMRVEAAGADGKFATVGTFKGAPSALNGEVFRAISDLDGTFSEQLRIFISEGAHPYSAQVAEIDLIGEDYIPEWLSKSGAFIGNKKMPSGDEASNRKASARSRTRRDNRVTDPAQPRGISAGSVVDLTKNLSPDGALDWQVPAGDWTVLRFGHASRGAKNRPAKEGEGLETDKFRRDVTKFQFDQYIGMMAEKHREYMGSTLVAMWQDSWETGCQNWSLVFRDEFKRRRGYDPVRYLPAMTGRAVGDSALGDRFLWDIRRTIADLCADNYMGELTELGKPYGIGLWFQPINRHFLDGLQGVGRATGAEANMFFDKRDGQKREFDREKFCASAAHGYGQTVVHSEAATAQPPTGDFGVTPANLGELVNANFCAGVNNHWMHVYLHQPWPRAEPGLSWKWGQQFQRNNTWFEKLGGWSAYVARGQYLLRQGLPVVDIVCFLGEEVPTQPGVMPKQRDLGDLPAGMDYDVCNAEIILTRMSVKDGRIVLPDGMSYALLVLPAKVNAVRPAVLRKIRDLVFAGATLVGNRPATSPSLENYPACDVEVKQIADELWGSDADIGRHVGSGMVYSAGALDKALAARGVVEDFSFTAAQSDARVDYYHRRTADADIYFVANRQPRAVEALCAFRVDGRTPELWQPDTGGIEPAAAYEINNNRTSLPLRFDPSGAMFVVFRQPAGSQVARGKNWLEFKPVQEIVGPWEASFDPKRGGPASAVTFEKLEDWSKRPESGIKYYSGTATYRTVFSPPSSLHSHRIYLDLGDVREVADVTLNGKKLGILWKTPFRVDITDAARAGENTLVIEVVNLWANRMIGDECLYPDARTMSSGPRTKWPVGPASR